MHGDEDNFSGVDRLRRWAGELERAAGAEGAWRAVEVEGADHFWRDRGKKREMLEVVREWVRKGDRH